MPKHAKTSVFHRFFGIFIEGWCGCNDGEALRFRDVRVVVWACFGELWVVWRELWVSLGEFGVVVGLFGASLGLFGVVVAIFWLVVRELFEKAW